jgi:hypothetical protein
MTKATVVGLQTLRRPEDVARARGKTIAEVLPIPAISIDDGATTPTGVEPAVTVADEAATEAAGETA